MTAGRGSGGVGGDTAPISKLASIFLPQHLLTIFFLLHTPTTIAPIAITIAIYPEYCPRVPASILLCAVIYIAVYGATRTPLYPDAVPGNAPFPSVYTYPALNTALMGAPAPLTTKEF